MRSGARVSGATARSSRPGSTGRPRLTLAGTMSPDQPMVMVTGGSAVAAAGAGVVIVVTAAVADGGAVDGAATGWSEHPAANPPATSAATKARVARPGRPPPADTPASIVSAGQIRANSAPVSSPDRSHSRRASSSSYAACLALTTTGRPRISPGPP